MDNQYLQVGKLVNTQGIKGEVRVVSQTDFPEERYRDGNRLWLQHPDLTDPVLLTVRTHRTHKHFDILSFEDHFSIQDVEKYKGGILVIPKEQVQDLPEGEYYFYEVIGCKVLDDEGNDLGKVKEVLQPGANDVWVVDRGEKQDLLLPVIDDCILDVDIKEKKIMVHIMEGLL